MQLLGIARKMSTYAPVIYIIDDEKEHRDLSQLILEILNYEIKTFENVTGFMKECPVNPLGCLISDVIMPGMSGVELQDLLSSNQIDIPIVFLSAYANVDMVKCVLKKGAFDFLEKPYNAEELVATVQRAISRSAHSQIVNDRAISVRDKVGRLTKREREILFLMLDGMSTIDIGKSLSLSSRTIDSHRSNILKKFDVTCFTELTCTLLKISELDI